MSDSLGQKGSAESSQEGMPTNEQLEFAKRGGKFLAAGAYTDQAYAALIVNLDGGTGLGVEFTAFQVEGVDKLSEMGLDVCNVAEGMMIIPGNGDMITDFTFTNGSVFAMNWNKKHL